MIPHRCIGQMKIPPSANLLRAKINAAIMIVLILVGSMYKKAGAGGIHFIFPFPRCYEKKKVDVKTFTRTTDFHTYSRPSLLPNRPHSVLRLHSHSNRFTMGVAKKTRKFAQVR